MSDQASAHSEIRQVYASSERLSKYRNRNTVRQFTFDIDEPEKLGGSNQAPTPMEYVLGSFNGCGLIVIEMVAKEINFDLKHLRAYAEGSIDRRGLFGTAQVSPHFQEVLYSVEFESTEDQSRLDEIKTAFKKRCPAYNLLHDAGVRITLDWKIVKLEQEDNTQ